MGTSTTKAHVGTGETGPNNLHLARKPVHAFRSRQPKEFVMRYTNPPPAPLIPPSGEFKTSLRLVTTVLTFAALLVLFIGGIATWLAPKPPFSVEKTLAGEWATSLLGGNPAVDQEEIETALQTLVDSLRGEGRVVTEIPIQAHYLDKPTINAMATLGGHIFVYRGIIEHCDSEDALA
ncbi:MAG TPA: hypothetical protein ENJ21_05165, partial [Chromatiaceae bacterium]|nr:hypothetical protein [Chromatiaceae bacterium]